MAERKEMNPVPLQDVATALNPDGTKTRITSSSTAAGQAEEAAWRSEGARLLTESSELTTLEDSLRHFGLLSRLQELDESLMLVRELGRTPEEHKEECKAFDKELQKLSLLYHPDRVESRNGSKEELKRAIDSQVALNATRTILNTLNKLLLEEFVMDHKYSSFTKLDLGLLGNVEEEYQGYEVLYKVILVSEIMQECMIADIKKFLSASKDYINSFLTDDVLKYPKRPVFVLLYLRGCYKCCKNFLAVLEELETECSEKNLHVISRLIQSMTSDLSTQLSHFEGLLKTLKKGIPLVPGELFPKYYSISVGERPYFLLPVIHYFNVILSCSIMQASTQSRSLSANFISSIMNRLDSVEQECSDSVEQEWSTVYLLYQLASYYHGHCQHEKAVKEIFGNSIDRKEVGFVRFREILTAASLNWKRRFNFEDYFENGKDYIVEGLTTCRELKAGFDARNKLKWLIAREEKLRRENARMRIIVEKSVKIQAELEGRISALERENASLNNNFQRPIKEKECELAECEELRTQVENLKDENDLLLTIAKQSTENESLKESKIVDLECDIAFLKMIVEKETELELLKRRIDCETKETQTEGNER